MALTEGGSTGTYTVKLAAAPNGNVTVTVASGDTGAVTSSPAKLTYTTNNWNTAQTVTLTPVADDDGIDESVTIGHSAAGDGYNGVSANLTATVTDDDRGISFSTTSVSLTEGGSTGTYTAKLTAKPSASVTVTVTSGDTGAVTRSPEKLTFTTSNFGNAQTVTLTPVSDADGADESVTVSHSASGGGLRQRQRERDRLGGRRRPGAHVLALLGEPHRGRQHRQLHGQAERRTVGQGDRHGDQRRHRRRDQKPRQAHLHHEQLRHRADGDPDPGERRRRRQRVGDPVARQHRRRLRQRPAT